MDTEEKYQGPVLHDDDDAPLTHKKCSACRSVLPVSFFGMDQHQPDNLHTNCRDCRAFQRRKRIEVERLRSARDHQRRQADKWRVRFEALMAALPDETLDRLPADIRPPRRSRALHRAKHRRRSSTT